MNAYRYTNGALELIEPSLMADLKWTAMGDTRVTQDEDYAWYCGLPSEETADGVALGFNLGVYRAASDRAPYPFMAVVGFGGDECDGEIYFPQYSDLIRYTREHAHLLQLTVMASVMDRIDEAMKWLFDQDRGIFRDHVQGVFRREYQKERARRAQRVALGATEKRGQAAPETRGSDRDQQAVS